MVDSTLAALCERLVHALKPQHVILFGSRARGTAHADSDYDILVVVETDLAVEDRVFLARRAVRDIRCAKDIFVVTPAEVREHATWVSGIVREAMEEGEVLYEAA